MPQRDIVVFGASGFTGALVAEYLVTCGLGSQQLALAGRDREKLEKVRSKLAKIEPAAAELPLLIADAFDRPSLDALARDTKVLCSTVGPYAKYGEQVVAACAASGTNYCDLTGEPQFVRRMIDGYDEAARATGARIVTCCGFDSVPSDLGTFMLYRAFQARGGHIRSVRNCVGAMRGGVSSGTIASALNVIEEASKDREVRSVVTNPYSLYPPGEPPGPDTRDQLGIRHDAELRAWTAPFIMAAINAKIVRRSNALLGFAYGREFRYSESMCVGSGLQGLLGAAAVSTIFGLGATAMAIAPLRRLALRKFANESRGPSRAQRERGHFRFQLIADGIDEQGQPLQLRGRIVGVGDPGYHATAMMLGEAARSLAYDSLDSAGGVRTPAATMGDALLDRLRRAGMTFEVC